MEDRFVDVNIEPYYEVKIGFNEPDCHFDKKKQKVIGTGTAWYYETKEQYETCQEAFCEEFDFVYDIRRQEIIYVKSSDEMTKDLVYADTDQFRLNLVWNLLPYMKA